MKGRLFYIVGASGAGKDSLIRYARNKLGVHDAVVFAHRYITRAPDAGGENHVALSASEFTLRERNGLFALAWQSHGYHYGVGIEIDQWLERSLDVVVNGSRGYLAVARARYAELSVVWINAKPQVLAARLQRRGRESGSQIIGRLARAARPAVSPPPDALQISNDGPLEQAGDRLVAMLAEKH
jgi:ribose 1,5-bisphosphokinase